MKVQEVLFLHRSNHYTVIVYFAKCRNHSTAGLGGMSCAQSLREHLRTLWTCRAESSCTGASLRLEVSGYFCVE